MKLFISRILPQRKDSVTPSVVNIFSEKEYFNTPDFLFNNGIPHLVLHLSENGVSAFPSC